MRITTILAIVGGGIVVVGAAGAALLMSIDVNKYKGEIAAQVEQATGRKLDIKGDLSLSIGLTPAVVVNGVSFANAPWSATPTMVGVERFEAEVDLMAALGGTLNVTRLVLIKPTIVLEKKGGKVNWSFDTAKPAAPPASTPVPASTASTPAPAGAMPLPALQSVKIEQARVIYRDLDAGTEDILSLASLSADAKGTSDPLKIALDGAYGAVAFKLTGTVGAIAALNGTAPYPIDLTGTLAGIDLGAKGSIAEPMAAKGVDLAVTLGAKSLDGLKPLVGELPKMPPVTLATQLKGGGTAWTASALSLTVGKSSAKGDVSVALDGARPQVKATVQAPLLDLQEMLPEQAAQAKQAVEKGLDAGSPKEKAKGGRVLPADPLPLSSLKLADAVVDLAIDKTILPSGIEIAGISVKGTLSNGVLKLAPVAARLGDGQVKAEGVIDASGGKSAKADLTITADKVILGKLFEQIKRPDLLTGSPTSAKLKLVGQGNSVAALAGSLNGSVLVTVGEGKIHNSLLDWAGADILNQISERMNPFSERQPYTDLSCGVVNLKAVNGVATWDKQIAFQTTKMNVVSSGESKLGAETLDIAVRPYAREGVGISAGKLAEMIRLQGTYADPKIGIDAEGVMRNVGSVVGALATGGTSLLAEALIDRSSQEAEPCKVALGEKAASSSSQSGSKDAKQSGSSGVLNGVTKGLGGLFGQ
ncbi:AsmA family protein [Insolitispirillum peregrinum]|uniref:AsmA domain-containing protein n=1 Tax=Insolitispirillum peregrinum TaxID=80876 RepID=A0A1N7Q8J3_9PROT|nr:AsmA family protein [Insolitispirillum peregrinum]SIT19172.1 hypothetical protein SAMN05421779_1124 [Insolitispirillum peregrinum]